MPHIEFADDRSLFNKSLLPDGVIHWSEAREHYDEKVSVYGEVASTYFDWDEYERWASCWEPGIVPPPTFIEIGAKFPNPELLRVVIWGRNRDKFERPPEEQFANTAVIVTGKPYVYDAKVHIQVSSPSDIVVVDPIANLYVSPSPMTQHDPNYREVFVNPPEEHDCDDYDDYDDYDDNHYDDDDPSYYDPDYDPNEYVDDRGWEVTKIGDYFYDMDMNVIDDSEVRIKDRDYW